MLRPYKTADEGLHGSSNLADQQTLQTIKIDMSETLISVADNLSTSEAVDTGVGAAKVVGKYNEKLHLGEVVTAENFEKNGLQCQCQFRELQDECCDFYGEVPKWIADTVALSIQSLLLDRQVTDDES